MKRINNIVISNTEPSVNSLWITQSTIKWFGKSGWEGLDFTDNTKLWNTINQEISDRQEEDKHIKEQASQNADNIATLKTQVGSNDLSSSNYLSKETNLTDAINQLDEELKATNDNLTLEHEYNTATYATKEEMNQADTNLQNSIEELSNSTDEKLNNYLPLAGGTMTGGITFESDIIAVQGKSDQDLLNAAGGTTAIDDLVTSIPVATPSSNGTMSSTDKSKLDSIAENANNYTLPNASTSVRGGVLMAGAIADTTVDGTETATTVATTLNSLLAALRTAGILMA